MGRAIISGLVLIAIGCTGPRAMEWQYDYAKSIPSPEARASAMAAVAQSAAYVDDMGTLLDALDDLKGHPSHDEVAGRCAVHLASATHVTDARRVAKRIEDPARRQEALDEIAKRTGKSAAGKPSGGEPAATQPAAGPIGP